MKWLGGGGGWLGVVTAPFLYGPVKWQLAGNSSDFNLFTFDFEKYMSGICVFPKCLRSLRKRKLNKLLSAHLNINFIRNKFDCLPKQVKVNFEILLV